MITTFEHNNHGAKDPACQIDEAKRIVAIATEAQDQGIKIALKEISITKRSLTKAQKATHNALSELENELTKYLHNEIPF